MRKLLTITLTLVTFYSFGQNGDEGRKPGTGLVKKQFQTLSLNQPEKKDIYELPNNFRGIVEIFYSEDCGQKVKKKKGSKIIQIPSDGILIIKNDKLEVSYDVKDGDQEYRYTPNIYYQVKSNRERTELPELIKEKFENGTENKYSKDDTGVFHQGFGSGVTYYPDTITYNTYTLFVGSYNDLTSDKYQTEYIKMSKESVNKLKKCRQRK